MRISKTNHQPNPKTSGKSLIAANGLASFDKKTPLKEGIHARQRDKLLINNGGTVLG